VGSGTQDARWPGPQSREAYAIPPGRIDTDWAASSSGGALAALPIVVFALLVQRHLVRGLTMGAVK
jgi:ABC-type glycerol-3-phosphate transport system permease component